MLIDFLLFVLGVLGWQWWYAGVPLTINEGIFSTIGQALGAGQHLYLDIWDHKPPVLFGLYEGALALVPDVEWACRLLAALSQALTGLFLALIAQRLGADRRRIQWLLGIYLLLLLPPQLQTWSAQADTLMLPFLLAAFWVALHRQAGPLHAVLAGMLWALSFQVKQTALFMLPLFFVPPVRFKDLGLWFLAGVNSVVIFLAVPFYLNGSDHLWSQALWGANVAYGVGGWGAWLARPEIRAMASAWLWNAAPVYLPFAVATVHWGRSKSDDSEAESRRWVWVWLALGAASCGASGKFFNYYSVVLLAPLAHLAASGASRPGAAVNRVLVGAGMLAAVAFFMEVHWDEASALRLGQFSLSRMADAKAAGLYIKAHAKPGQGLWVEGHEAQIYAYADKPPCCSRYFVRDHRRAIDGEEAEAQERLAAIAGGTWLIQQTDSDFFDEAARKTGFGFGSLQVIPPRKVEKAD